PDKLLPHYTKKNFESVLPRFTKIPEKSSVVYFYRNGINFIEERKKIILKKWMLKDWNVLLSELTAIMPLVNGAIYSIYHASSLMPVKRLQEIDDNKCFVAVGRERFIKPLFYSSDIANESDESGINANLKADRESTRKSSTNFLKGFNSTQREEEKSQPLQSSSSLMLNSSISSSTANLPSISDLQDRESGSIKSIKRMTSICQARPSNVTESSRND
ncbi:MAG: Doublecortin domain-containing protein 2, partial [Marteilia pararefringens]